MKERLLIVGGSVRAAAMSARRADFDPIAIDRFADADLREVCRECRRYDHLHQVPEFARQMPAADWMYTGPLENHPDLIAQLSRQRTLLGNDAARVRQIRDPQCVAAALQKAGLQFPELSNSGDVLVARDWLKKPLRTAGGFGVERLDLVRTGDRDRGESSYFQRFIAGRSVGATFLGARGRAVLVGVAEQLLGPHWGGSREFQYVGSIGPVILSPQVMQALTRVGDCIAASFSVQGLFGVDAIINDDGVWPVEVNPRYTASVEVLERAFDVAAVRWHVAACRSGELPEIASNELRGEHGKAIVYARRNVVVDEKLERELCGNHNAAAPRIADIPMAGASIKRGEPIATVFAQGTTNSDVKANLRAAIAEVLRLARDA